MLTTLATRTLSYLDGIATQQAVVRTLNKPMKAEGRAPSDDGRINLVHTDGDPYLSMNNRLLYGFRHEPQAASSDPPWICRFGGILMQPDDEAQTEDGMSHYAAYDPWQRLMQIPVVRDDGTLPVNGLFYKNKRGSQIAVDLLANADAAFGSPFGLHIDYGQFGIASTAIIENTAFIDMHFDQGTSLGDAWSALCDQGIDINLDPVYDPLFRPGITSRLRIEQVAGSQRDHAIFAWDKPGRSTVGISRLKDGARQANKIIYYGSQGVAAAPQSDAPSIAKYGQQVEQKTISGQPVKAAVELIAQGELQARKNGGLTLTLDQSPEPSPIPLLDYDVGDVVPVYASTRLRQEIANLHRVYEIPLDIGDDGRESAKKILVSDPSL